MDRLLIQNWKKKENVTPFEFFFLQITTEFTKEVESVCVKRPK